MENKEQGYSLDEVVYSRHDFAYYLSLIVNFLLDEKQVNRVFLSAEKQELKEIFKQEDLQRLLQLTDNIYATLGNCD